MSVQGISNGVWEVLESHSYLTAVWLPEVREISWWSQTFSVFLLDPPLPYLALTRTFVDGLSKESKYCQEILSSYSRVFHSILYTILLPHDPLQPHAEI